MEKKKEKIKVQYRILGCIVVIVTTLPFVGFDCGNHNQSAPNVDSSQPSATASTNQNPSSKIGSSNTDIRGNYFCKDGIYDELEFRSSDRAVIHSLGLSFPITYSREGNYLYLNTDKGDQSIRIVSPSHLEGEGWFTGTYIRR